MLIPALVPALLLALADTGAAPRPATPDCHTDTVTRRMPVYVRAVVEQGGDSVAASGLALIVDAVATRIRRHLGGSPAAVPREDSLIASTVDGTVRVDPDAALTDSASLHVVLHRGGRPTWSGMRTPLRPATGILDAALAEARDSDEVFLSAEQFRTDSLPFTLGYAFGAVPGRDRMLVPEAYGPPTAIAFTIPYYAQRMAEVVPGTMTLEYPPQPLGAHASGVVVLQFAVDTSGQADESTIRDLWPADRPRYTGAVGAYYDQFVAAARRAVLLAAFRPAELAGCKMRQDVRLPFHWTLGARRR